MCITIGEGRSCRQVPYRIILNQQELVQVLVEEGYTVKLVDFAGMSAPEQVCLNLKKILFPRKNVWEMNFHWKYKLQIEISREANLFIAVHGAGVANIFWYEILYTFIYYASTN